MSSEIQSAVQPTLPSHSQLIAELRALRRAGLPRLRQIRYEGLAAAAVAAGITTTPGDIFEGIERLLAGAVDRLDGIRPGDGMPVPSPRRDEPADALARAAARSFGIPVGRGESANERRKAAALVYGVSTESFRHRQEVEVIAGMADAVLALARRASEPPPAPRPVTVSGPPQHFDGPAPQLPDGAPAIEVHLSAIELLRDIDILVSSENTYLEMSKTFSDTVSGALRRAASVRDEANAILDDPLNRELTSWLAERGRTGLQVPAGTVVPTGPGALAARGVRRIHHAAVAIPKQKGAGYEVREKSLAEAVAACFRVASAERDAYDPPLTSICFPVLGAGRGGLPRVQAARWLRWAVCDELSADPRWKVHLVTRVPGLVPVLRGAS